MERSERAATQAPEGIPRYATVLRCDVVYATESEEPFDASGRLLFRRRCEEIVAAVTARHGGYATASEGDGIAILFGVPKSRQGAASSALRTSIDLARAIATTEIMPHVRQQVRVGIASGLIGLVKQRSGSRGERLAGRTMNIAKSALAKAGPGQILVADATKRLAADSLHFAALGTVQIIGLDERVRLWELVNESPQLAHFDGRRIFSTTTGNFFKGSTPPPPFPGPGDFVGAYDASPALVQNGGQSTYKGSIAITLLDRTLVENVLPTGFSLAGRTATAGNQQHPVICLVGHQDDPLEVRNGATRTIPNATPYQEMILLIPFVLNGSGTKWHSFVVRMYLDDAVALAIGNSFYYDYEKRLAYLTESGTDDDLTTEVTPYSSSNGNYFRSEVKRTGAWRSSDDALLSLPRWSEIKEIFEMPMVGVNDDEAGFPWYYTDIACSYWEWDHTNAEVAPATSQHSFFQPFRNGMNGWVALGQLSSAPNGAVMIRGMRWRLPLPTDPCQF